MLLISDSCHSCFACLLQTVHPIPVIFISISTEIISSFQRHTRFAKIMPGSSFSFRSTHMHCIPHLAYHAMFMCWLFTMLFLCLFPGCFSRYLRFRSGVVRIRSTSPVCLLHGLVLLPCGISGKMTIPSKSLLC